MPPPTDGSGGAPWLAEEWIAKLAISVELMTEARPGLRLESPVSAPDIAPEALWYSIPLSIPDAAIFIGAGKESWLRIGTFALLAAGVTEVSPDDARSTYLEIITQATSGLAQSMALRLGTPVSNLPAKEIKLGEEGFSASIGLHPIEVSLSEPPLSKLYLGWSHAVELALASPKTNSLDGARVERAAITGANQAPPEKSRNLDLLMEVELPVSVSFGRAQLPLRDVLKLNSGSIVELNRTISDPVEIIVNNCVIARGEVVVVEGNYGVRIHHVISREERLRTLK